MPNKTGSIFTSLNLKETLPSYFSPIFEIHLTPRLINQIVVFVTIAGVFVIVLFLFFIYIKIKRILEGKYTLLEIKPPAISLQSAFSTRQLFTIFHSLEHESSFLEKLLKIKKQVSYEIVSTKEDGIRYLLHAPYEDIPIITKNIRAYLPSVTITEVTDYIPQTFETLKKEHYSLTEFKLSQTFALPLLDQDILNQYDPIAYITAHMTKLQKNEIIVLQIVSTPIIPKFHNNIIEYTHHLNKRILAGKEIISQIDINSLDGVLKVVSMLFSYVFLIASGIIKAFANWFRDFLMPSKKTYYEQSPFNSQSPIGVIKELSPKQLFIQETVEKKINQNLFETSIRLFIVGSSKNNISLRKKGISASFATFNNPGLQSLEAKHNFPVKLTVLIKWDYIKLKHRLLSLFANPILSTSELSSIYHLPYSQTTKTEDLLNVKSPMMAPPLSLKKSDHKLDIIFAHNSYGETTTPIGLTLEERERHTYIIGATGTGKTTMLLQMIYQDILNGKGLAVVDPHGDLTERLLGVIPKKRVKDIVYFNPYDINYPIGLNILELSKTDSEVERHREKDLIVSSLVSIFHKLYPERYSGPRMEHILRNTVLTALELDNPTLFTVYKLLTDSSFRKQSVWQLKDDVLKEFWKNEFEKQGSYQKAEQISPITNKLGRFLTTTITRRILIQEKSKLNFDEIMNKRKILICDLSKGKIGEDTSSFLGSLIIAKLQLSALKRIHIPEDKRTDFFLYIDEFQNFATITFAQILSEARKYKLNTILAHQTISQIEDQNLLKIILANVATVISFRTSNPSDENTILPIFAPQVTKNEISNLPSYSFYIKINALYSQDAFSGTTSNFLIKSDENIRKEVLEYSRHTYGMVVETPVDTSKSITKKSKVNVKNRNINKDQELVTI